MRASRIALALWLGVAIATATGCTKSKSSTPACRNKGEVCAAASECCSNTCNGACDPDTCTMPGGACSLASSCCTNKCENQLCIKEPCASPDQACAANEDCCNGQCDTATHKCKGGGGGGTCTLGQPGAPCTAPGDCCSKSCYGGACSTDNFCVPGGEACVEGHACCSGSQCSGGICPSGTCTLAGNACAQNSQCCSWKCSSGSCVPPGGGCTSLYESCTANSECCSKNCQGPTGAKHCIPAYWCNAPGDRCLGPKDCCTGLCTVAEGSGVAGYCEKASGSGCTEDGVPCEGNASNCCTRMCLDPGSGATVCQISGGCRMTGDYCDSTAACCGGSDPDYVTSPSPYGVYCDLEGRRNYSPYWDTSNTDNHVCSGGQSCNPPGNICGGSGADHVPASQNCCHEGIASGKDVCKPDSNGIMRCFGTCGGTVNGCPYGCDGTPTCCIDAGQVCHMTEECCNGLPCIKATDGVLRCMPVCLSEGQRCSTDGDPGTLGAVHAPPETCCSGAQCRWLGTEIGWACALNTCTKYLNQSCTSDSECCTGTCDATGHCSNCNADNSCCQALNQSCSVDAECCSPNVCDPTAHKCIPACLHEGGNGCTADGDCCPGLTCSIPAGGTSGMCTSGPTCALADQSCLTLPCCDTTNYRCQEGTCQPILTCAGPSVECNSKPCCTTGYNPPLNCHESSGSTVVTCASSTGCFCEQCAANGESCTATADCCAQYYCNMSTGKCQPTG